MKVHVCKMYTFCNKFTFILHLIFTAMHIDSTTAYTVRTVLADFAVCDWWRYCKALFNVKFSQMEENGRKFRAKQ